MKAKRPEQSSLIEGGKERLENTSEFRKKVEEINKLVRDKYALILLNEKHWIKRILIIIRREIEIRRRISELSSRKNLHTAYH
jgi:hypothetical protein